MCVVDPTIFTDLTRLDVETESKLYLKLNIAIYAAIRVGRAAREDETATREERVTDPSSEDKKQSRANRVMHSTIPHYQSCVSVAAVG